MIEYIMDRSEKDKQDIKIFVGKENVKLDIEISDPKYWIDCSDPKMYLRFLDIDGKKDWRIPNKNKMFIISIKYENLLEDNIDFDPLTNTSVYHYPCIPVRDI